MTCCGHDRRSHNTGTCTVVRIDYEACGCTAIPFDGICRVDGAPFVKPVAGNDVDICWSHSEREFTDRTAARFAPLSNALEGHGIHASEPWNTGGHVMCLPVDLPTITLGETHTPYLLFSDDAEVAGCGMYLGSEATGISLEPAWWPDYATGMWALPTDGWGTRDLGERTAAWLASIYPSLLAWFGTISWAATKRSYAYGKDYWVFTALYGTLPELPGTVITDHDAA